MSLTSRSLYANSNHPRISSHFLNSHLSSLRTHNSPLPFPPKQLPIFPIPRFPNPRNFISSSSHHRPPLRALQLDGALHKSDTIDTVNFDAFLSVIEFLCLLSSAAISVACAVNSAILGNGIIVWQSVLAVGAVAVGALIRRRQWKRICAGISRNPRDSGVDLIGRIERLEEDIRSSVTVVRVLSRKLEKLGIRFRVTRRTLKEPLAETTALAQKNSEATQALAVQEDMLEKELSEIQNVLLAMQEQQRKQLELILAIGKAGKLWDAKRETTQDREAIVNSNSNSNSAAEEVKKIAIPQIQAPAG